MSSNPNESPSATHLARGSYATLGSAKSVVALCALIIISALAFVIWEIAFVTPDTNSMMAAIRSELLQGEYSSDIENQLNDIARRHAMLMERNTLGNATAVTLYPRTTLGARNWVLVVLCTDQSILGIGIRYADNTRYRPETSPQDAVIKSARSLWTGEYGPDATF